MSVQEKSPAMQLMDLIRDQEGGCLRNSWERYNAACYAALKLAVNHGFTFHLDDVPAVFERLHHSTDEHAELFYALACGSERGRGNPSFCKAFEHWKGRRPFKIRVERNHKSPQRVYVGLQIHWYGELATVTSFHDDGLAFVACTYKLDPDGGYDRSRIDRRINITHTDIKEYHQALKLQAEIRKCFGHLSGAGQRKVQKFITDRGLSPVPETYSRATAHIVLSEIQRLIQDEDAKASA